MRKILLVVLILVVMGCGLKITKESQRIPSVSDTSNCIFIESKTMLAMPYNFLQGVQQHALNSGGDSFKILATAPMRMQGIDMTSVSFEIYKCKK